MAKLLKLRRGTTSQHSSFTGAEGEVTVDTDKETLVVHNGSTAGGFPLARELNADDKKTGWGAGEDLQIWHDATNSDGIIRHQNENGHLKFLSGTGGSGGIEFRNRTDAEYYLTCTSDAGVALYYDNSKKFETTSTGISVTGGVYCNTDGVANGVQIGAGNDLILQHNGTNSFIDNNTGDLYIQTTGSGDDILIESADDVTIKVAGSETAIQATGDGAVELYHNNVKKLETTAAGATVTGALTTTTSSTLVGATFTADVVWDNGTHAGNDITWDESDSTLEFADGVKASFGNDLIIGHDTATIADQSLIASTADLYVSANTVLFTDANNATAFTVDSENDFIHLADSHKFKFGTGNDLEIYHDGSNSYLSETNGASELRLRSHKVTGVNAAADEYTFKATENAAVELYYDNSKKFETTSAGVTVTGDIAPTGNINLVDSSSGSVGRIRLGAGADLVIYHDGSNSYIMDDGAGELRLRGTTIRLSDNDGSETFGVFNDNGSCELYYDNVKKLETVSTGIQVWGSEGGDAVVYLSADESDEDADDWKLNAAAAGGFYLENKTSGSWETNIKAEGNGGVSLYYDNTLTCYTSNTCLAFPDGQKILMGGSNDLQLYHDSSGGSNYINSTTANGDLILDTAQNFYVKHSGETMIQATNDGSVELYEDGSKKLETTAGGILVSGNVETTEHVGITGDNKKLKFGAGEDLQIYHDGTDNHIDFKTGQLNIRPENTAGSYENGIIVKQNDAVELYYNDSKKVETTNTGISVTGGVRVGGNNAANELDDYEEGTWTPDPHDGSCTVSFAKYIKVGRQVTCWAFCTSFSDSSTNDQIKLKDLPFTPAQQGIAGTVMTNYTSEPTASVAFVDTSSRITFFGNGSSADHAQLRHNEITNANFSTRVVVTYDTDS